MPVKEYPRGGRPTKKDLEEREETVLPEDVYEKEQEEIVFQKKKKKPSRAKPISKTQREEIKDYLRIRFRRKQCRAPAGYYNLKKRRPELILQLQVEVCQEFQKSELEEMRQKSAEELREHMKIQKAELEKFERKEKRKERLRENVRFPCMEVNQDNRFDISFLKLARQIIGKMGGTFDDKNHYWFRELAGIHKMMRDGTYSCKEIYWELQSAVGMIRKIQEKVLIRHVETCLRKDVFPGTEDERREEAAIFGLLVDNIDKYIEAVEKKKKRDFGWLGFRQHFWSGVDDEHDDSDESD